MKLDVTLGDLTKIGKSQKHTLSVDVDGGRLVVLKKQRDAQEDWNTFSHDKSERGGGGPHRLSAPPPSLGSCDFIPPPPSLPPPSPLQSGS